MDARTQVTLKGDLSSVPVCRHLWGEMPDWGPLFYHEHCCTTLAASLGPLILSRGTSDDDLSSVPVQRDCLLVVDAPITSHPNRATCPRYMSGRPDHKSPQRGDLSSVHVLRPVTYSICTSGPPPTTGTLSSVQTVLMGAGGARKNPYGRRRHP
jgi:hypothetical protein